MMDPMIPLKFISDLALWFSFGALLFGGGSAFSYVAVIALLLLFSGTLSALLYKKKPALRFPPLLLALYPLFFIRDVQSIFLVLPPSAYVIFTGWTARYTLERWDFEPVLKWGGVAAGFFVLFAALFGFGAAAARTLPFLAIFLVSGVTLLRVLRQEESTRREPRFLLLSLAAPAALCIFAVLLSFPSVLAAVARALSFLYEQLIIPILMLLVYAFYGIVWLLERLFGPMKPLTLDTQSMSQQQGSEMDPALLEELQNSTGSPVIKNLILGLAMAAFIVAAIFLFRRLLGKRKEQQAASTAVTELRTRAVDPKAPSILSPRTPREGVRRTYQRFLRQLERNGVSLPCCYTAAMIEAEAKKTGLCTSAPLHALTILYCRARYSPHATSREEARMARALLKAIFQKPDESC